ncbi:acyl-CoA dehydrogenase family protein [Polymorphospora sp. NPDC051019]|uniref:acyl-CoA dehydrogenase family protein n=1 Tax=Polymorphospora sp. NPDC051019 TaxID=3155725 RepID=UPI00341259CE
MTTPLDELWRPVAPPDEQEAAAIRAERVRVREFLAGSLDRGLFAPRCDSWLGGFSPEFSKALAVRGWIGMTWPRRYGGRAASNLLRQAVVEELLAAGAPVAAHWFADRQVGPGLLRYGSEEQRDRLLPAMARGELYVAIGMSEPDSGSDLASVRTRARQVAGGWRVTGTKVWTSHAHRSHLMLTLVRTAAPDPGSRHAGFSQLLVDLSAPGVTVNPIPYLDGGHHFNEVVLDDVFVSDGMVVGTPGQGWTQVTAELAHERSGPERYLSTFPLLERMSAALAGGGDEVGGVLGRAYARLWVLRQMSTGVARSIDAGTASSLVTALVKDMGTRLENEIVDEARRWRPSAPAPDAPDGYDRLLAQAQLHAPGFTLRGGTSEILRGLVARAIGMR